MEPEFFFDLFLANLLPIAAFFIGVIIADCAHLFSETERISVWLFSIPTGLVTTGILMLSASISTGGIVHYGYMASVPKYAVFLGIVIFYGTAVPELFTAFRARLIRGSQ